MNETIISKKYPTTTSLFDREVLLQKIITAREKTGKSRRFPTSDFLMNRLDPLFVMLASQLGAVRNYYCGEYTPTSVSTNDHRSSCDSM